MKKRKITADFLFKSKFMKVKDSRIHYIDVGEGDPIVFLHGVPTSSYIWRNIIPHLSSHARCIAPDLIGMGKSGKPDIDYTVFEHIDYIEDFIDSLNLKNITLVLHGLGSLIGLHYASKHKDNIKAIAFYESYMHPIKSLDKLPLPVRHLLSMMQNDEGCYKAIVEQNYFFKKLLPHGTLRDLSKEELEHYIEPFKKEEHRKPLWQYVQSMKKMHVGELRDLVHSFSEYLKESIAPKLLMYSMPGFLTTMESIQWCRENYPNTKVVDLGDGYHFAQETDPNNFAEKLRDWYIRLENKS